MSSRHSRIRRGTVSDAVVQTLLILGGLVMIIPFVWMFSTSLKPPTEVLTWPPNLVPKAPTLSNYTNLFKEAPFGIFFLNSVLMSVISTASILLTSIIGGYVFAKFKFPGQNLLFAVLLATAIVPFESYLVPLYLRTVKWKWMNTYRGMIAPYLVMSFGIFLMRQHIASTISDDLLDAARIDGCSEWRILRTIIFPLCSSASGALGIFAFIQAWTAFIWPLLVANQKELFNMELGLTMFQFRFSTDYGFLMAGSVLSLLPIIIVFILLSRQITESIALTGLKG
jgi:multiple sugar transport system permease protein